MTGRYIRMSEENKEGKVLIEETDSGRHRRENPEPEPKKKKRVSGWLIAVAAVVIVGIIGNFHPIFKVAVYDIGIIVRRFIFIQYQYTGKSSGSTATEVVLHSRILRFFLVCLAPSS